MESDIYNDTAVQQYGGDNLQDIGQTQKMCNCLSRGGASSLLWEGFWGYGQVCQWPISPGWFWSLGNTLHILFWMLGDIISGYLHGESFLVQVYSKSNCLPYGNLLQIGQLDFMPGRKSLCPGGEENPRDQWLANDLVPQWQVGGRAHAFFFYQRWYTH